MNIRIDSVAVNGLGPIGSIKWKFNDINLIFGKNEQGKTFLVEFLLKSLFRYSQKTRPLPEYGQVVVSGIQNVPLAFDPKYSKKRLNKVKET